MNTWAEYLSWLRECPALSPFFWHWIHISFQYVARSCTFYLPSRCSCFFLFTFFLYLYQFLFLLKKFITQTFTIKGKRIKFQITDGWSRSCTDDRHTRNYKRPSMLDHNLTNSEWNPNPNPTSGLLPLRSPITLFVEELFKKQNQSAREHVYAFLLMSRLQLTVNMQLQLSIDCLYVHKCACGFWINPKRRPFSTGTWWSTEFITILALQLYPQTKSKRKIQQHSTQIVKKKK